MSNLSYIDDSDRAFGATGMAIGIAIADAEEMADGINIDLDPAEMMLMADVFWLAGHHGEGARQLRRQIVNAYHVTVVMSIANLLCRSIVGQRRMASPDQRTALRDIALIEGRESCCLDDDEITALFDKDYNYLTRVFSHSGVQEVARQIASTLTSRRSLSRIEMLECLRPLSML